MFVALSKIEAVNPGFRTEITQKGLEYSQFSLNFDDTSRFLVISQSKFVVVALVREIGPSRFMNEVQSFDIPDQTGENDGFKWKLSE